MSHHSSSPAMPGVNLGGWLVLERWMTPSVFAGTDATNEYELSQTVDGQARIQQHRQTFIQEADIKWLAQAGIRLLRLPIGYWALDDQPPYLSAKPQIDWLMDMARQYDLQVLLDLHAAPGAQNTSDHSGSGNTGNVQWYRRTNQQKINANPETITSLSQIQLKTPQELFALISNHLEIQKLKYPTQRKREEKSEF